MDTAQPSQDIHRVAWDARRRIREQLAKAEQSQGTIRFPAPTLEGDPLQLYETALRVRMAEGLAGQLPPQPPTLRGFLGGLAVRLVRRALFWYTPRILKFQNVVTRAVEDQSSAIENLIRSQRALSQRVEQLKLDLAAMKERGPGPDSRS